MNYMIYDKATKQVAIEFSIWLVVTKMWQTDLTYEELYDYWLTTLDKEAMGEDMDNSDDDSNSEDMGPEYDSAGYTEDDRIVDGQYRVIINK